MIYLTWAAFYGKVAGNNPWPATGLEWNTQSPPPTENFEVTPVVTWEAYDFHNRPDLGLDVPGTLVVPRLRRLTGTTEDAGLRPGTQARTVAPETDG